MPETFEEVVKEVKETFGGTSPEAMTPEESAAFVESIREASGLSAAGFARAFGVAPETAESCLKGESIPARGGTCDHAPCGQSIRSSSPSAWKRTFRRY